MSAVRRLVSGNVAGAMVVLSNLLLQVALVPLFLHMWDPHRYGIWIALTTATALITIVDNAHLDFLGFECLKLPPAADAARSRILSDALPVAAAAAAAELGLLVIVLSLPGAVRLLAVAPGSALADVVWWGLIAMMLTWLCIQMPLALLGRVLGSVGHYATTVWWALALGIAQGLAPAAAALAGADLGGAMVAYVAATIAIQIACGVHYRTLARRQAIRWVRPDLRSGLGRWWRALRLGAAALIDYFQQTGFRLILLPVLGPLQLVQFATTRTVSNVVQQGLQILANPTVPELMRYIALRDPVRIGVMMSVLLAVPVLVMCPSFVALQVIAPPLYAVWTLGKVPFDGGVLTLLSVAVLMAGLAQANRAIVRGNNLVNAQLGISLATGALLIAATVTGARYGGVIGAAAAIAVTEAARSLMLTIAARRWFGEQDLAFPGRTLGAATICVAATIGWLLLMTAHPDRPILLGVLYLPGWGLLSLLFWRAVPVAERGLIVVLLRAGWRRLGRGGPIAA